MTVMAGITNEIFGRLDRPRRIWAVAAIHAEVDRLAAVHDRLGTAMAPGDRLVYLGNLIGHGTRAVETFDELLRFRRQVLTLAGAEPWDVVYLRGAQEEMLGKLMQLQFAPNPREVLGWMIGQGVGATLASYGIDAESGFGHCREGAQAISRWTGRILAQLHARPGHDEILAALRRYAVSSDDGLLFVNGGLDEGRPLSEQRDTFWWGGGPFAPDDPPYGRFRLIVRGFDRSGGGVAMGAHRATIDGGCGFGGPLNAACFAPDGTVADWVEA